MRNKKTTVNLTLTAIFAAATLALSFIERLIMSAFPLPMGVKPGLANVLVMFICFSLGLPQAFVVILIKSGFIFLTSGFSSGLISLFGGVLSVLTMFITSKVMGDKASYIGISALSAVMHNLGQITASSLLIGSALYLSYAPMLLVTGVIFGVITGLILNNVMPALKRFSKL